MKAANCFLLLPSECAVDKKMRCKEAFPFLSAHDLGRSIGKSGNIQCLSSGDSQFESGGDSKSYS